MTLPAVVLLNQYRQARYGLLAETQSHSCTQRKIRSSKKEQPLASTTLTPTIALANIADYFMAAKHCEFWKESGEVGGRVRHVLPLLLLVLF